jgi:hypothetical protein
VACWGFGKEGIVMSDCTNTECVKKWKAKQDRKLAEGNAGKQRLNVESSSMFEFHDVEEFSINEYSGFSFHQGGKIGDNQILLDNQSTHITFYVSSLLPNIRKSSQSNAMFTNGGPIIHN